MSAESNVARSPLGDATFQIVQASAGLVLLVLLTSSMGPIAVLAWSISGVLAVFYLVNPPLELEDYFTKAVLNPPQMLVGCLGGALTVLQAVKEARDRKARAKELAFLRADAERREREQLCKAGKMVVLDPSQPRKHGVTLPRPAPRGIREVERGPYAMFIKPLPAPAPQPDDDPNVPPPSVA